ncbi:MAG: Multi-sensor signal transduction histidine kinase [Verrucomicrobiales bacterium]|nr:Multi-sensor signal transduction histidine kinase [Verrucomicrobiales bacterium]
MDASTLFAVTAPVPVREWTANNNMDAEQVNRSRPASRQLRVLLVEDSEQDALLLQLQLSEAAWKTDCKRVFSERAMRQALAENEWDLVISDYVLPGFSGLKALSILRQEGKDIPFIIVSGMIGEETAVAAMKAGAHDYLMKDNLARLVPAIERELREAESRRERRVSEEKLKVEHSFRKTIENSIPSGLAVLNLAGVQTYVNPSFCEMVGWNESELVGIRPPFPYWPPEEREMIESYFAKAFNGQAKKEGFELRFQRKDGTLFDALVLVAPLLDVNGRTNGWVRSVTDITQRKMAEEALRRAHGELEHRVKDRTAELSQALKDLKDEIKERQKLAHELVELADEQRALKLIELHDDLGQRLAGMSLIIKGLELKIDAGQPIEGVEVRRISDLLFQAIAGAQDVSSPMERPSMTGEDLLSAVKGLVRFFKTSQKIACSCEAKGNMPMLPQQSVVHLYRITLEAMANAIKHGKAKRVKVVLAKKEQALVLTITSDGKPFPDIDAEKSGLGLRLMYYRATLLKASISICAGKRGGTVVTCTVPLTEATRA